MAVIVLPTPLDSECLLPSEMKEDSRLVGGSKVTEAALEKLQNSEKLNPLLHFDLSHCPKLPYENSVASVCFSGTIFEKIDAVAKAGFDSIEIMTPDLEEATPEEIYQYCQSRNISISILQPFRDLEGYSQEKFQERLREFEEMLKICTILRTDTILVCANCDPESSGEMNRVVSQLKQSARLAAKYNVKVAYENLSWAAHYYEFGKMVDVVVNVNEPNFGICVDLFHINIHGSSLDHIDRVRNKVFFVQFCDSPNIVNMEIIQHARNYRVFPFGGSYTNIIEAFHKVQRAGYTGCLSLEVFNKLFKDKTGQCLEVAEDAFRSLVYLQLTCCEGYLQELPNVNVTSVYRTFANVGASGLEIGFQSEADIANFKIRAEKLCYSLCVSSISAVVKASKSQVFVNVSRMLYNRYALLLKTAFSMQELDSHPDTKVDEHNLPVQTSFGNDEAVITLRVTSE